MLCRTGSVEDILHYVQFCPALAPCRRRFVTELSLKLPLAGKPGLFVLDAVLSDSETQLRLSLGQRVRFPPDLLLDRLNCGMAEWTLDKISKNFFLSLARLRHAYLGGSPRIIEGRLWLCPAKCSAADVIFTQESVLPQRVTHLRKQFFAKWMPTPADRIVWSKCAVPKRPSPFFVVWRGRVPGVFYNWSDCKVQAVGLKNAAFQGFASLEEAEFAFASGRDFYN